MIKKKEKGEKKKYFTLNYAETTYMDGALSEENSQ
jgi:hypothetical protein